MFVQHEWGHRVDEHCFDHLDRADFANFQPPTINGAEIDLLPIVIECCEWEIIVCHNEVAAIIRPRFDQYGRSRTIRQCQSFMCFRFQKMIIKRERPLHRLSGIVDDNVEMRFCIFYLIGEPFDR